MTHRVSTTDDLEVGTYLEIAEAQTADDAPRVELTRSRAWIATPSPSSTSARSTASSSPAACASTTSTASSSPTTRPTARLRALQPKGFILSGGPASVYAEDAPLIPQDVLDSGKPILGICYGMQALAYQLGGEVEPGSRREYGPAVVHVSDRPAAIFRGLPPSSRSG